MENILSKEQAKEFLLELHSIYTDKELSEILWFNRPLFSNIRYWRENMSRAFILALSLFKVWKDFNTIIKEKRYNDIIKLCQEYIEKYDDWIDDLLYDLPTKIKGL